MKISPRLMFGAGLALALAGVSTLALSQGAGQQLLTTLLATYQVPIQTTGALQTNTTLATLKTFIQSGGTAGPGAFTTISATGQITSTLATGTAPLVIASTTNVANLNASSLSGATFAAPGAIGGTTPAAGAFTTLSATGQFTSTVTTGTAPFVVASTTVVANLNASALSGATFAAPGTIGGTTPAAGTFTVLTNTSAQVPTGGVGPAGGFTLSPRNWHTCNIGANAATAAFTDQTPVATEVYFAEIFVPANATITGVAVYNGSAVSGNMKVGLANSSGVVVATSASTAASGTTVYQRVPFTGTYAAVGPATYYVLTFYDNNTQRPTAFTVGNCAANKQTGQTFATGFTTITPGTTFTTALGPVAALY